MILTAISHSYAGRVHIFHHTIPDYRERMIFMRESFAYWLGHTDNCWLELAPV